MSEFAGLLSSRIEVWRRSGERLPTGIASEEWVPVCRCLARVEAEGTGVQTEGMTLSALPRYRVLLRVRDDLAIDQRVHWRGRQLAVRQMVEDPSTPDRMTLRCEEVRA